MHAMSGRRRPDDATAALTAANAVSVVRHAKTPYAILAGMQATCGLVALALAVGSGPSLRRVDVAAGLIMLALAAFTWWIAPRTRFAFGLGFSLFVVEMLTLYGATQVQDGEDQTLVGLGLVLFGAFAGYFRPKPFLWPHLGFLTVGYVVAYLINPQLAGPIQLAVIVGIVGAVTLMISSLTEHLRELALHDPLTGALNRRGLDLLAPGVAATAARAEKPVTVGVIDLDGFKAINNRLGHLGADAVLVGVADAWLVTKRESDVVARLGGDEFVVVLAGTTPESALELQARARTMTDAAWTSGFALWAPEDTLEDAVRRADQAMLDAKHRDP